MDRTRTLCLLAVCGVIVGACAGQDEAGGSAAEPPATETVELRDVDWAEVAWSTDCTGDRTFGEVHLTGADDGDQLASTEDGELRYGVSVDGATFGDVTDDGLDNAAFVASCTSGDDVEFMVEVWGHDARGRAIQLPTVSRYPQAEAEVRELEVVDGRLRVHSVERHPEGDPDATGYPVDVVTDWTYDDSAWSSVERSRSEPDPIEPEQLEPEPEEQAPEPAQPDPEPPPTTPTIPACEGASGSPEGAARCLYAATGAGDADAAASVATSQAIAVFQEAKSYDDFGAWQFDGCGGQPIMANPSSGISCTWYSADPGAPHGYTIEAAIGLSGDEFFVEDVEFIG